MAFITFERKCYFFLAEMKVDIENVARVDVNIYQEGIDLWRRGNES